MNHVRLTHGPDLDCGPYGCNVCNLFICKVCGGAEGSLPTKCPGHQMTPVIEDLVYKGIIDFEGTKWVEKDNFGPVIVTNRPRPQIVCLCGSTRFSEAFRQANFDLTLEGKIVLTIGCDTKSDEGLQISDEQKQSLDELHKRKIDLCDEVLVLNVGGYIGSSTLSEIRYAAKLNRKINFLEPTDLAL